MKFILAKKLNMTQIFEDDGRVIPVTAVLASPNVVTQVKTVDRDGYRAVQLGLGNGKRVNKPESGHLKGLALSRTLREIAIKDETAVERGDVVTVATFAKGDAVDVIGWSKGRGFQGVVKRHGFHGSPKTHGHKDQQRMPGSIGAGGVQRVFKNVRMAGHMGDDQVTIKGLEVVAIDVEQNILYIKGAVPGARHSLLVISGPGELLVTKPAASPVEVVESTAEEAPAETESVTEEAPTDVATPTDTDVEAEPAAPEAPAEEPKQ